MSRKFSNKLQTCFNKSARRFKNNQSGYIFILMCCLIPVILLGTKLVLDTMTAREAEMKMQWRKNAYRPCAEKAALAVAQNWNPGVSLNRQKRAVLKVADAVYNDNIMYMDATLLQRAIPGIQVFLKDKVIPGKGYDPLKLTTIEVTQDIGLIQYATAPKYQKYRYLRSTTGAWNLPFMSWKIVDKLTSLTTDDNFVYDKFDELDQLAHSYGKYVLNHFERYQYPRQVTIKKHEACPTRSAFSSGNAWNTTCHMWTSDTSSSDESGYTSNFIKNISNGATCNTSLYSSGNEGTYTYRIIEDNIRVKVAVEDDKIKVTNDTQSRKTTIGYAVPAECNVDIVLACPTNAAATNQNNCDINSSTPEMPYEYTSGGHTLDGGGGIEKCPIYQIGQAFRTFAKEFYHTRGVTMGIIPYSGKVSLDPDMANSYIYPYAYANDGHTDYFNTSEYNSIPNGQNTTTAYLRGATLYDSHGEAGADLNTGYNWNTPLTACPIRCRGRIHDHSLCKYTGTNFVYLGDIFSTLKPTGNYNTSFFRQNSNPCYGGYANLLSMKCDKNCTTYLPNPYYIIEPTADIQKIYEICGAFYPFYDEQNVSNFIFIPVTWANNLWQSWTRDPGHDAVDTDGAGKGGQLKIPSKMDAGRKKVLILVVNKPDWFQPHELTYLGFDNDYSEIPMIESDHIDFAQNFAADSAKKFADGSNYDGTIQGPKKILQFTSDSNTIAYSSDTKHYESPNGNTVSKCHLTFPRRYLVKLVVEPRPDNTKKFDAWTTNLVCNLNSLSTTSTSWSNYGKMGVGPVSGQNNQLLAVNYQGQLASSDDGINWVDQGNVTGNSTARYIYTAPVYDGKGTWCVANYYQIYYSTDQARTWKVVSKPHTGWYLYCMAFGNGIFMTINAGREVVTSSDGKTWKYVSTVPKLSTDPDDQAYEGSGYSLGYIGNRWVFLAYTKDKSIVWESFDNGVTWTANTNCNLPRTSYYGIECVDGKFFTTSGNNLYTSSDGVSWNLVSSSSGSSVNITYYKDKLYKFSSNGASYSVSTKPATIKFTNLIKDGTVKNNSAYTVNGRQEFYIESDQIFNQVTNGRYCIDFEATNAKLISAEISNRPYIKVKTEVKRTSDGFETNCQTPFHFVVVPSTVGSTSGTMTYTDAEGTERTRKISSAGQLISVTPQTYRYVAEYDSDGVPIYKINITFSDCYLLSPPEAGEAKYYGTSCSPAIRHSSANSGSWTSNNNTFTWHKTNLSTSAAGAATIEGSRIYCPAGAQLCITATPAASSPVPTITFNKTTSIGYMGKVKHELYKPTHFCFEPYVMSGITQNGKTIQYVNFETTGNVQVAAECICLDPMSITVSKPDDVIFATYTINAGYYNSSMKWTQASTHPKAAIGGNFVVGQVFSDGGRCYIANTAGNVAYSDDFGKTWRALGNNIPEDMTNPRLSIGNGMLWFVDQNGKMCYSSDEGQSYTYCDGISALGYDAGNWCNGFVATQDANSVYKFLAVSKNGHVVRSKDGINWEYSCRIDTYIDYQTTTTIDGNFDSGPLYTNGLWIIAERNKQIIYRSYDEGKTWNQTYTKTRPGDTTRMLPNDTYHKPLAYGAAEMIALSGNSGGAYYYAKASYSTYYTRITSTATSTGLSNTADGKGLCFANDNFIAYNSVGEVALGTWHDGYMTRGSTGRSTSISVNSATFAIDPTPVVSNGVYISSISVSYIKVEPFEMIEPVNKFRTPEMSRYVDYTKSDRPNNLCSQHSNFEDYWSYNGLFWANKDFGGTNTDLYFSPYHGDYCTFSYSDNIYTMEHFCKDGLTTALTGEKFNSYPVSGFSRTFTPFERFCSYNLTNKAIRNGYTDGQPGAINLIMQTMTLPVNAALYYAYYDGATHPGEWYTNSKGAYEYNATNAAKNATAKAFEKLKADWGENLRIYLIKFRKQTGISSDEDGNDITYKYLDDTGAFYKTYNLTTNEELQTTIKEIASEVKTWAGYTEAKLEN